MEISNARAFFVYFLSSQTLLHFLLIHTTHLDGFSGFTGAVPNGIIKATITISVGRERTNPVSLLFNVKTRLLLTGIVRFLIWRMHSFCIVQMDKQHEEQGSNRKNSLK